MAGQAKAEPELRHHECGPISDWPVAAPLERLTVIYDDGCEVCRRCRHWLENQDQLVHLDFVRSSNPEVRAWAGNFIPVGDELVVVADDGRTWVGPDAFIVCLWALRGHRRLAARLDTQTMRPVAKKLFHGLSAGRGVASAMLPNRACADGCNL